MTNPKNEFTKTVATRIRPFKWWSILLALVLVATTAGAALASDRYAKGHTFKATFTKWVTFWPPTPPTQDEPAIMVGVVGGDVGPGTYTGEVISVSTVDNITTIEAFYHLNGSKHAFTADLTVIQNDSTGRATLTGRVTEGWEKGASVTGVYKVWAVCPIETPGNVFGTMCFQGSLRVLK